MKVIRLTSGLTLASLIALGLGCSSKSVIVPTDQKAAEIAAPQPPPPVSFGGPGGDKTDPAGTKVNLRGVGGGGAGGETKPNK
jgi:hypothetical protein